MSPEVDPAASWDADNLPLRAAHQVEVAVEWFERAFGALLDAHHEVGHGQEMLVEAADALDRAGHPELARRARSEVAARNAAAGRWTYQVLDEFRAHLLEPVRAFEEEVRGRLTGGVRHRAEALSKREVAGPDARTTVELPED
ncbi:MAG TPA: hypothetical protein VK904_02900 [Miltoncostaeaceae bacterium]|nr:hypothetical protein [Miltoncostaeaceae bacterium]